MTIRERADVVRQAKEYFAQLESDRAGSQQLLGQARDLLNTIQNSSDSSRIAASLTQLASLAGNTH